MKKITLFFLMICSGLTYGQYLTEGFEGGTSIPAGWTLGQTNASETWKIGTTAAAANNGTNYAIVEYDSGLAVQNESLTTPALDFTSATNPRLIFWWNMSYFWSVSPNDNYDFTVSIDDGNSVTQVFTETDEVDFDSTEDNFEWFQRTIDLSGYVGQNNVKIIFNYSGLDGASLSIDDILVEETPSCEAPSNVIATTNSATKATITWTAGASETEWTYEYGPTGFTQGNGTSATVTTTSATITGLTSNQSYDVYVQANCGAGDDSAWTSVVTWQMPIVITPNYSAVFDTYPQDNWSEASGAYGSPSGTSSEFTGDDFINDVGHSNGRSAKINIWGTGRDEYLISPGFDLSGGTYYLNFDVALTVWNEGTAANMGSDDYVALLVTQDGGSNWTELMRWDSTTSISETGESITEIVLNGYGDYVQFAFYAYSDTSNEDNDFFIDNFQITDATLGVRDEKIDGFKLYPTIAQNEVHFSARGEVQEIVLYNTLGQLVMKQKPNTSSSSIDVSRLKSGMYIAKVISDGKSGIYRIIKE